MVKEPVVGLEDTKSQSSPLWCHPPTYRRLLACCFELQARKKSACRGMEREREGWHKAYRARVHPCWSVAGWIVTGISSSAVSSSRKLFPLFSEPRQSAIASAVMLTVSNRVRAQGYPNFFRRANSMLFVGAAKRIPSW